MPLTQIQNWRISFTTWVQVWLQVVVQQRVTVTKTFKLQLNKNYDAVLKIEQNPIPSKYQH